MAIRPWVIDVWAEEYRERDDHSHTIAPSGFYWAWRRWDGRRSFETKKAALMAIEAITTKPKYRDCEFRARHRASPEGPAPRCHASFFDRVLCYCEPGGTMHTFRCKLAFGHLGEHEWDDGGCWVNGYREECGGLSD